MDPIKPISDRSIIEPLDTARECLPGVGTQSYATDSPAGHYRRPRSAGRPRYFRWIDARLIPLPALLPGRGVIALSSRILLHR